MSKSNKARIPSNAIPVHTFVDVDRWLRAWADGHINLEVLLGDPGLAKSQLAERVAGADALYLSGTVSPIGMYINLYRNRGRLVVVDDVD